MLVRPMFKSVDQCSDCLLEGIIKMSTFIVESSNCLGGLPRRGGQFENFL